MVNRINQLIEFLGFSQTQFADHIGVKRSIMSHIITGRNNASLEVIGKILQGFKQISPDWLMFGEGSMVRDGSTKTSKGEPVREIIKKVDHITIYYEDNTYCNYYPKS